MTEEKVPETGTHSFELRDTYSGERGDSSFYNPLAGPAMTVSTGDKAQPGEEENRWPEWSKRGIDLHPHVTGATEQMVFTKFPTYNFQQFFGMKDFPRVGVPGHETYDYASFYSLLRFAGSSFQATLAGTTFYLHIIFFAMCIFIQDWVRPDLSAASFPSETVSNLRTLCVFTATFFTGRVASRFNERFHDCCKTNGAVTVVTALSTGYLSESRETQSKAVCLIRYTVAILHIYYMLISGKMDERKWDLLLKEGILTKLEIGLLRDNGSPGVVLYAWSGRILQDCVRKGELETNQANRIEENISTCRGLAAKQIAYTITQMPLVYFHIQGCAVHFFTALSSWQSANHFVFSQSQNCDLADDADCPAYGYGTITVIGQLVLIYMFVGLYQASVWMSDPMGTAASNYDLEVDLKNLWTEALNCIKAMVNPVEQPIPELSVSNDGSSFSIATPEFRKRQVPSAKQNAADRK